MDAKLSRVDPGPTIEAQGAHAHASISIDSVRLQSLQWWVALFTVGVPTVGTLYALWAFVRAGAQPAALVAFGVMHLVTMLGITVGFHRYGAHRSFECGKLVRSVLVALGSMAAQGPLVHWVSNHRRHHQFSDKLGDVHSPWTGNQTADNTARRFWHAHVGWMFAPEVTNPVRYARDLLQDAGLMRLSRAYLGFVALGLVGPALLVGGLTRSWDALLDTLLWAGLVRVFSVHHVTWSINSVAHIWGSRHFRSADRSVNVAWLALPSAGESWHNGHHAFPGSARFGLAWYELDLGYALIWSLEQIGLARQVNRPSAAAIARATLRTNTHATAVTTGDSDEDCR